MIAVNCVKGEIHNLLAVLRLMQRSKRKDKRAMWMSSVEDPEQEQLVDDLKNLHHVLGFYSDLNQLDTCSLLEPFLGILRCKQLEQLELVNTTLRSLEKFLLYGYLNTESPRVRDGLDAMVVTLVNCKIELQSKRDNELISIKLMEVLLNILRSGVGHLLSDDNVCMIFAEIWNMRYKNRPSSLLIKYTENTLILLNTLVFQTLVPNSDVDILPKRVVRKEDDSWTEWKPGQLPKELKIKHKPDKNVMVEKGLLSVKPNLKSRQPPRHSTSPNIDGASSVFSEANDNPPPFGIPTMVRIFEFLSELINPHSVDEETREFGLRLLNTALETAGHSIGDHPQLLEIIQNQICKEIIQNSQTQNFTILSLTLRIVFDLFQTCKEHLRIQLECFLTSIHLRVLESPQSTFEVKELVLESLVEFCHEDELIIGLFINYDCDVNSTNNLFEDLCKFLGEHATPPTAEEMNDLHLISAEGLMAIMECIAKRFVQTENTLQSTSNYPSSRNLVEKADMLSPADIEEIRKCRAQKRKMKLAANNYNADGKKSFKYLQQIEVLPDPITAESIADFFWSNSYLNKTQVGNFLCSNKEMSKDTLKCFCKKFNYTNGTRLDEGLRQFLESFMLGGEAQQISRVMEIFAEEFFDASPGPLADQDSCFILSFAIIQLNTDAHNDQVKNKMTTEGFKKNLRGCNGSSDFPPEYLDAIYKSITENEIKIRSEDPRELIVRSSVQQNQWDYLMERAQLVGGFRTDVAHVHGKEMFALFWESALNILDFHLRTAENPKVVAKAVDGLTTFSRICHAYDLNANFNCLIVALSSDLSGILKECSSSEIDAVQVIGADLRVRRIFELLFMLIREYGSTLLGEGWQNVVHVLLWLHKLKALSTSAFEVDDFRDNSGNLLPSVREEVKPRVEESGIFSVFTSSFWTEQDESEEQLLPSDQEEREWQSRGRSILNGCEIDRVFSMSKTYRIDCLIPLVRSLLLVSSQSTINPLNSEIYEASVLTPDASAFCLERITDIVRANVGRVDAIWPLIILQFRLILSNVTQATYFVERAIVNLLRLAFTIATRGDPKSKAFKEIPGIFHLLCALDNNALKHFASRICVGGFMLLKTDVCKDMSERDWEVTLQLFGRFARLPNAGITSFHAIEFLVAQQVNLLNYTAIMQALLRFGNLPKEVSCVRQTRAMQVMLDLHRNLAKLQVDADAKAQSKLQGLWMQSLAVFSETAKNPSHSIRKSALECLQRAVFAVPVSNPSSWQMCFETLLFPLLSSISKLEAKLQELKTRMTKKQQSSVQVDLRLTAISIVCKCFLHQLECLKTLPDFPNFWMRFLSQFQEFMRVNAADAAVSTHCSEMFKNMILVMKSDGTFESLNKVHGQDIYGQTVAHLMPDLKKLIEVVMEDMSLNARGSGDSKKENWEMIQRKEALVDGQGSTTAGVTANILKGVVDAVERSEEHNTNRKLSGIVSAHGAHILSSSRDTPGENPPEKTS